jgi:metal-sulfur cluster biosynthetic enzyme
MEGFGSDWYEWAEERMTATHDPNQSTSDSPELRVAVLAALHKVEDPELGIDVVELGLVYALDVIGNDVRVKLSMTTPACPVGEHLLVEATLRIEAVAGVRSADVQLVWEPAWTPERMTDKARAALGWG